ncbi:unnamed protein product [Ectocarpus sp. CCAP 1310/34]|nr:unnamed protein product [Ectocarpus sp. CCAP 1310/34]
MSDATSLPTDVEKRAIYQIAGRGAPPNTCTSEVDQAAFNRKQLFSNLVGGPKIDGEIQGITSSTRLSLSSQQDASSARGAAAPSQHPPAAAAGGDIWNAFSIGSGQPIERTRGGVKEFVSGISFPPPAPESRRSCPYCPMTFERARPWNPRENATQQCKHANGVRLRRMLRKNLEGRVLPWEEAGPGRCSHVKVDDATGAASFVLQRKRFLDLDLESDGIMDRETKDTRGAPKRRRYDYRFKANAEEEERTPLQYSEDRLKVHYSNIVRRAKDEKAIVAAAADDVKKSLLAKQCSLKVSTPWLTITFRKLVREMYPGDQRAAAFRASFRWAREWAKRHNLSKRRRTNLKNKFVEDRLPNVSAITTVAERESNVPKYGQFQLWERWNVDQVPLAFVNGLLVTWEERGAKRVAISQPFSGLEKRPCTMQVIFGPGETTLRISVIFRGTGKRISPVEKAAYHKDVDVFFQENAWGDQKFCMEWAKRSYRQGLMRGRGGGRFIKVEAGRQMDMWLEQSDNLERWETAALTASDRQVLITRWIGAALARLNSQQAFRFRVFEKCGMAMTVDGSGDDRITLEGSEDDKGLENGSDEPEGRGTLVGAATMGDTGCHSSHKRRRSFLRQPSLTSEQISQPQTVWAGK